MRYTIAVSYTHLSLAGNDTILVITQTPDDGEKFEAMIAKLRSVRK